MSVINTIIKNAQPGGLRTKIIPEPDKAARHLNQNLLQSLPVGMVLPRHILCNKD